MDNCEPDESDVAAMLSEVISDECPDDVDDNMETTKNDTKRRPDKRNREGDKEEMWTTVSRKGKRYARANSEGPIPDVRYEVCMSGAEQLPKRFKLAKLMQSENIKNVKRVKYINSFRVLIQFDNEESADDFIESKKFKEMGIKIYKTMETTQTFGVIKDIDLDYTEEEILESLSSDIQILGIKRLKRLNRVDGKWENSEKIKVCFKGTHLSHVKIFDTIAEVTPYVYPVTQCSRCWRYGHSIRFCPSYKIVCPKCGENHENCTNTTFKCNNCGGKHMAMARICPIRIKEKQIRELMSEFGVTYKKALTIYVPPSPSRNPRPAFTKEDFPYPNKEYEAATDTPGPSVKKKSYAETTRETRTEKKKKGNKKQTKASENFDWFEESETSVGMEASECSEAQHTEEEKVKKKEDITWALLLKQLKDKLMESRLTWEERIKSCFKIIYSGVISIVVKYLSDWPIFKLFNNNG